MANLSVQGMPGTVRAFIAKRCGSLFFFVAVVVLFAGFNSNAWHAVPQADFDGYQIGWQSFIVGRGLKTSQDGLFSGGGLPGLVGPDTAPPSIENPNYRFQYEAFKKSLPFTSFAPYESQIGGQGMLFGILDLLFPQDDLAFFQGLTALLSALSVALILAWIFREFGWLPAVITLIATVPAQWLTLFGRNLWWSLWAFYLPAIIVGWYLSREKRGPGFRRRRFGLVVFCAVFLKCFFNGYEYITTTLIMLTVPLAYYSFREKAGWKTLLADGSLAVAASGLAILASMVLLCVQISAVEGSFLKGVDHIVYSLLRRTYADPQFFPADYSASLTANPIDVVLLYLRGIYADVNYYLAAPNDWVANFIFQFRYLYLIVIFTAASILVWIWDRSERERSSALIAALWFSLLAPLSWFVIFKAHSYVHTFLNNIVWQMPFTLLGFAVCGLAIRAGWEGLRKKRAS